LKMTARPPSRPRRRFLQALAAAPLVPSALLAAQAPPAPAPAAPPTPTPSPTPSDAPGPVAQALGQAVRHRYGSQLEAADLAEIDKGIEQNLQAADRLKNAVKLGNADEPVTLFEARPRAPRRRPPNPRPTTRG
jgi:hypothetical protein